eukprot:snap_masked-scaffold_59-processed-gene-0.27-mRNA-1 protein AED:1.00 eAED:1.00 QI:0/0/0/0/1/1/6/0/189
MSKFLFNICKKNLLIGKTQLQDTTRIKWKSSKIIILDIQSDITRIGYSEKEIYKVAFSFLIAKYISFFLFQINNCEHNASFKPGFFCLKYPFEEGFINYWDLTEEVFLQQKNKQKTIIIVESSQDIAYWLPIVNGQLNSEAIKVILIKRKDTVQNLIYLTQYVILRKIIIWRGLRLQISFCFENCRVSV